MIGYKFVIKDGFIWKLYKGGALPLSFPLNKTLISNKEANKIRKNLGLLFLRWEDDFDLDDTITNWWHIIKSKPDTLLSLPSKTRYMIKKASENFEARPVSVEIIRSKGYEVYLDSFSRYITDEKKYSKPEFIKGIEYLPTNTEWWGVFEKNTERLVGFSENFVEDNKCFFVSMWHRPSSMKLFSSYLHFYEMEKHYLINSKFDYISDGTRSINHNTKIHEFLVSKFKYRKAYSKLRIVYNPLLLIAIKLFSHFTPILLKINFLASSRLIIALKQEAMRYKL